MSTGGKGEDGTVPKVSHGKTCKDCGAVQSWMPDPMNYGYIGICQQTKTSTTPDTPMCEGRLAALKKIEDQEKIDSIPPPIGWIEFATDEGKSMVLSSEVTSVRECYCGTEIHKRSGGSDFVIKANEPYCEIKRKLRLAIEATRLGYIEKGTVL